MRLSINKTYSGKPAGNPDRVWWRDFNGSFENVELLVDAVLALIREGFSISTQHHSYRRADNFVAGQHIGLDFDKLGPGWTLDRLAEHAAIAPHAAIVHTTANHTPGSPRFRVIFELDRAILRADKYALLAAAVTHTFDQADKHCKDACRFFYGSPNCDSIYLGNVLDLDTAAELMIQPYQEKLAARPPKQIPLLNGKPPAGAILPVDTSSLWLEQHRLKILDKFANAGDGEKYDALRDVAVTFGGYVAAGYWTRDQAEEWISDAIVARQSEIRSMSQALERAEQAFDYGLGRPIWAMNVRV